MLPQVEEVAPHTTLPASLVDGAQEEATHEQGNSLYWDMRLGKPYLSLVFSGSSCSETEEGKAKQAANCTYPGWPSDIA